MRHFALISWREKIRLYLVYFCVSIYALRVDIFFIVSWFFWLYVTFGCHPMRISWEMRCMYTLVERMGWDHCLLWILYTYSTEYYKDYGDRHTRGAWSDKKIRVFTFCNWGWKWSEDWSIYVYDSGYVLVYPCFIHVSYLPIKFLIQFWILTLNRLHLILF